MKCLLSFSDEEMRDAVAQGVPFWHVKTDDRELDGFVVADSRDECVKRLESLIGGPVPPTWSLLRVAGVQG